MNTFTQIFNLALRIYFKLFVLEHIYSSSNLTKQIIQFFMTFHKKYK